MTSAVFTTSASKMAVENVLDAEELASWDHENVGQWLKENGFISYVELFSHEHKIDGLCLLNMTERDLREPPMQIPILGDVKRLWFAVLELRRMSKVRGKSFNLSSDDIADELKLSADFSDGKIIDSDSDTGSEIFVRLSGIGDKWRTLVSVVYCFLVLIITSLTMTVVHDRVPDMSRYPPLPDIFLDNMPLIPWAFYICELSASTMAIILVLLIIMHKHRLILIRRICAIVGTVFLLRCVTMFVTSLSVPGVHLECSGKIYGDWPSKFKRAFTIFFGGGMALNGVRSCGDYMYSGHTCVVTLLNFFISEYSPRRWHFLHTICWLLNIFGIFFILAAHEHYSIDVFIAFYISSRLFLYYHALASSQSLSQRGQLKSRVWFPLFWFFENSCKFRGKVPNEYEWPISLPFWNKKND